MEIFSQKKYKLLVSSIVILAAVSVILDDFYGIFQILWISDLYYIVEVSLVWVFLFFLRKENFKSVGKTIINFIFVLITVVSPLAFILDLVMR